MSRHAKNNTASAVFTYYERSQLKYGTQKQRLGKDSLKHFDACGLCLQPVIDPMACLQGHLYCKECIFENILAQKKEIKKSKKIFEEQQKELLVQEEEKKQQQKAAEIESFGKSEFGILSESHQVFRSRSEDGETVQYLISSAPSSSSALVLHESSKDNKDNKPIVSGAADPDKEKLKLNSFWVPSLTPSAAPKLLVKPKKDIMCIEGNHPIRLKQLIKVKFTLDNEKAEKNNSQNNRYCCPVCKRTLTDAPKAIVLKTCGHVLCYGCSEKFKNEKVCNVCDTPFRADHVILLQSGGTGFAGHDAKIMAKKEAVSAWV